MTKKDPPRDVDATPNNPFGALSGLRDRLPQMPPPQSKDGPKEPPKVPMGFEGKIVVRKERKGHGGKTVTVVQGVAGNPAFLDEMARDMKKALGCGARVEDGAIVLQGDLGDRAVDWLTKKGAPRIVRGS